MHRGYMWVFYGNKNEAAFLYSDTRAMSALEEHVKYFCGTLITDGCTVDLEREIRPLQLYLWAEKTGSSLLDGS